MTLRLQRLRLSPKFILSALCVMSMSLFLFNHRGVMRTYTATAYRQPITTRTTIRYSVNRNIRYASSQSIFTSTALLQQYSLKDQLERRGGMQLFARRKTGSSSSSSSKNREDEEEEEARRLIARSTAEEGWVTVKIGPDGAEALHGAAEVEEVADDMEQRIREARRLMSRKLDAEDEELVDRELKIEAELLETEEDGDRFGDDEGGDVAIGRNRAVRAGSDISSTLAPSATNAEIERMRLKGKKGRRDAERVENRMKELMEGGSEERVEAAKLRGFLEMNPFLCSGCGTPFQSKAETSPGFLPREKFRAHREKAMKIRDQQEAMKVLEIAGMEFDSDASEAVLREAGISEEVISSVRAIGTSTGQRRSGRNSGVRGEEEEEEEEEMEGEMMTKMMMQRGEGEGFDIPIQDIDVSPEGGGRGGMRGERAKRGVRGGRGVGGAEPSMEEMIAAASTYVPPRHRFDRKDSTSSSRSSSRAIAGNGMGVDELNGALEEGDPETGLGIDTAGSALEEAAAVCICQRCFRLQQYGQVEDSLRPGWSSHELLTPERFATLLKTIRDTEAVVLCIVDIFDLQGSLLPNLKQIVGPTNPLVIAVNKFDLLPKDASENRIGAWVHAEVKRICGLRGPRDRDDSPPSRTPFADRNRRKQASLGKTSSSSSGSGGAKSGMSDLDEFMEEEFIGGGGNNFGLNLEESNNNNINSDYMFADLNVDRVGGRNDEQQLQHVLKRSNVHLVSCQTGYGMEALMRNLVTQAMGKEGGNKVYVMGAANVGKSSFINRLLETNVSGKKGLTAGGGGAGGRRNQQQARNKNVPHATVSNLPGTTLDFLKIKLANGITMIDTPGLINKGQLTARLSTKELRSVIPARPVNAVTLRLQENKCVLLGGLAKIELLEGKPFFLTFFVSNEVKLHPTDSARADEIVQKHVGQMLSPPESLERLQQLQPFVQHDFEVEGEGWRKSSQDIVIAGLGWVAVTGVGTAKLRVSAPQGASITLRPALLPFESTQTTVKFTGGRLARKSTKGGGKGHGWRA